MKSPYQILERPVISEKAFGQAEAGHYVFHVPTGATKLEVRRAVEQKFEVKVVAVNTANVKGRKRRYGKIIGRTSDYKKAVVTLAPGEKIAMFEGDSKQQPADGSQKKKEEKE
jgi:large subunit ribosomal protein L23